MCFSMANLSSDRLGLFDSERGNRKRSDLVAVVELLVRRWIDTI
jgi:hypothetical protein